MRGALRIVLLAGAVAAGTVAVGWWAAALIGFAWAILGQVDRNVARQAALSGGVGWAGLLLMTGLRGPVLEVARRLGGVMHLPTAALLAATLAFPALLAWSAAVIGAQLLDALHRPE
jgi:hypothetical protein